VFGVWRGIECGILAQVFFEYLAPELADSGINQAPKNRKTVAAAAMAPTRTAVALDLQSTSSLQQNLNCKRQHGTHF
jgi:hypothetical protein